MSKTLEQLNILDEKVSGAFQYKYEEVLKRQDIWHTDLWFEERTPDYAVTFRWLEDLFALKEGRRYKPPTYEQLRGHDFRVILRKWEKAVRVSNWDIYADRHGQAIQQAEQIGAKVARLPQDLIVEILNLGQTSAFLTFDGVPLFDNAHPKGDTTFDNLLAGTLSETSIQAGKTALRRFPSDEGANEPLDLVATHLWYPPDLDFLARKLLRNSSVPGGSGEMENVVRNFAKPLSDARFTDVDDWGMISVIGSVKPFVRVVHEVEGNPTFVSETGDESIANRDHEERRWWLRLYETMQPTKPEFQVKFIN